MRNQMIIWHFCCVSKKRKALTWPTLLHIWQRFFWTHMRHRASYWRTLFIDSHKMLNVKRNYDVKLTNAKCLISRRLAQWVIWTKCSTVNLTDRRECIQFYAFSFLVSIAETLRISPPGFGISKVCTEPVELTNYNGKPVLIEPGTIVHIPIYSIHNDPDLYAHPERFDPDRFDPEKCPDLKTLRDEGIFFPFGHGPRICMGMRYSTLLIKTAIVEVVRNFVISVNERTAESIEVKPKDFLYMPIHDIFLDYKPIEKWQAIGADKVRRTQDSFYFSFLFCNSFSFCAVIFGLLSNDNKHTDDAIINKQL